MSLLWKILFRKEQEFTLQGVYQHQFQELHVGCQTEGVLALTFWINIKTWSLMMSFKTRTPHFMQWSYEARPSFIFLLLEAKPNWKFLLDKQLANQKSIFCFYKIFFFTIITVEGVMKSLPWIESFYKSIKIFIQIISRSSQFHSESPLSCRFSWWMEDIHTLVLKNWGKFMSFSYCLSN